MAINAEFVVRVWSFRSSYGDGSLVSWLWFCLLFLHWSHLMFFLIITDSYYFILNTYCFVFGFVCLCNASSPFSTQSLCYGPTLDWIMTHELFKSCSWCLVNAESSPKCHTHSGHGVEKGYLSTALSLASKKLIYTTSDTLGPFKMWYSLINLSQVTMVKNVTDNKTYAIDRSLKVLYDYLPDLMG